MAVKGKPKEITTGPEAFANFTRLMRALLAVPKKEISDKKLPAKSQRRSKPKAAS